MGKRAVGREKTLMREVGFIGGFFFFFLFAGGSGGCGGGVADG